MITRYPTTVDAGGPGTDSKTAEEQAKAGNDCRCKETSNMKPRELLGLMIRDLAFWKKSKKERI